jgi:type IV pilus assembly protein PilB
VKPSEEQLAELGLTPQDVAGKHFYQGAGCERCNNTGYKGRTAIHEFLTVNEEMRDIILRNGSVAEMRESAQRYGMLTLRDAGLVKVFEGTTTIEEVVRETVLDA